MDQQAHSVDRAALADGVPAPIVKLNRWVLLIGIAASVVLQQPLGITLLFLLLLPAVLFGQRWSPIAALGRVLFADAIATAEREDRRLTRFNNGIAVLLLGSAQLAFALGLPVVGWVIALMVAGAAAVALSGFCVGCFLYYQLKLQRYRLFG